MNSVVDALLMQGLYKNTLHYFNRESEDKIKIVHAFMDYKLLFKTLVEKMWKNTNQKFKGEYFFLS